LESIAMATQPPRRFGVLDGMILVAALAVASLSIHPALGLLLEQDGLGMDPELRLGTLPRMVVQVTEPTAAALTVAFLLIRLRRPRPRFRRLMRQPGMAAGIAAASAMMVGVLLIPAVFALVGVPAWEGLYRGWFLTIFEPAGGAVAAVWLFLALARVGRPEAGWIDRLGRALGGFWIVAFLAMTWGEYWTSAVYSRMGPTRMYAPVPATTPELPPPPDAAPPPLNPGPGRPPDPGRPPPPPPRPAPTLRGRSECIPPSPPGSGPG